MRRRHPKRLDEIDHQLMKLLADDPRASQRALAQQVGVTDETVGSRLRRLREEDIIATTAVVDWAQAGYGAGAIVRITIAGGAADELAGPLSEVPGLHFASVGTGCCDLVVALLGSDRASLRTAIGQVSLIEKITVEAVDVVTASPSFNTNMLTLPLRPWVVAELPDPDPPLDDLDRALIGELVLAAHESNRELARRLSVSDGTVRARIRRLEDGGLLKVVAGHDPVATGEMRAYAMAFITLEGDVVTGDILGHPMVLSAHEAIGQADLIVNLGARSESDLAQFLTYDVRSIPGVRAVSVAHLAEVLHHQTHLVRFS